MEQLGLARVVFVNMLDRERADFPDASTSCTRSFRRSASPSTSPDRRRARAHRHGRRPPHVRTRARRVRRRASPARSRTSWPSSRRSTASRPRPGRWAETDEELMERYLDGQELGAEEVAAALKAVTRGEVFPVACGVATRTSGRTRAARPPRGGAVAGEGRLPDRRRRGGHRALRVQDRRRPVRGPHQPLPRAEGNGHGRHDARERAGEARERIGALLELQGKEHKPAPTSARATSARSRS